MTKEEVIKEINKALKQFGEYSYYDKGASEVLDVEKIVDRIVDKYKTPKEIAKFLEEVFNKDERKAEPFVLDAIFDIIDRKFDQVQKKIFIGIKFIQEFYGEVPPRGGIKIQAITAKDIFDKSKDGKN